MSNQRTLSLQRAVEEVREAQRLIKDPGDRYEVSLVLTLAEAMAENLKQDDLAKSLSRFARAIREGLFD